MMPDDAKMSREQEIFLEALEQPSLEARAAFVRRATAGDPKLRDGVEALLSNTESDTFLEHGAADLLRNSLETTGRLTPEEEQLGGCIGRYKLLEKIGEGGFGVVYRAEQSDPVRRHVALKVIKLGMDTKRVIARFEAERQALALMDHPNIARVLDGGATVTGRPFFVMELVRGVRITEYCEANRMRLEDRLSLFIRLCHAIQHAHQKGVIHRDLKPSNVLVTVQDGKPVPKVIDFGIAKAIEEPLTDKTILTNFHAFLGTPAYTSPEQAEMTGTDADTRSDIYSLGVLLYELLTGVTPFDAKELTQSGLDGMRRMIKEVEPPTPSTRLRRVMLSGPANQRGITVDRDLDWIVMKCIEKDRARRYSTAQELAADLERYLGQEPVLARPQSSAYRLQKAFRRNRAAFAAAAAILLAVATGTTVSVMQAIRATLAERDAEHGRQNEELMRLRAEREKERALESQEAAERNEYVADINLAHQSILAGNLARAKGLLSKHRAKGLGRFEWRYLSGAAKDDKHRLFAQESSSVLSLAISADWLVIGLRDSIQIYDWNNGDLVKTLAKSGSSVALSTNGLLATASKSAVRVWRTTDWSEAFSIPDHQAPVAFSADGRFLAANSPTAVRVYDSSNGVLLTEIPNSTAPFAFGPDGNVIAVDTIGGIALWDVNATKKSRTLEDSDGTFTNSNGWMRDRNALAFSADGQFVVAARNTPRDGSIFVLDVWSAATGRRVPGMSVHRSPPEHSGTISRVAIAPDGNLLASGSWDHSVRLWDFGTREPVETLHGNPSEVWALAITPDGQSIISGAKDGAVRVWPRNDTAKEVFFEGSWIPLMFSIDGQYLAAKDAQSRLIRLNLQTGEPEEPLPMGAIQSPAAEFRSRPISEDWNTLVESRPEDGFRVWNLRSKESVNLEIPGIRKPWAAISPDGSMLLGGGFNSVLWWNLQKPSEAPVGVQCNGALFSRDSSVMVTLHDRSFKVWECNSRSLKAEFAVEAEFAYTTAVSLSDDGRILAAGSDAVLESENAIRLWDTRTGKLLGVCKGHTQGVRWLAFAPDSETLASVSDDSTLRFWNVRTQQELLSIQRLLDPIRDILFSPDGHWLAAKTVSGLLLLDGSHIGDVEDANTHRNTSAHN